VEFQERFSDEAALLGLGGVHEPTTYREITHAAA
jgi:hypothetical protein